MLSVFVVILNLIIFVSVFVIIARNIMNIKNISDRFKTMYQNGVQEEIYNHVKQNYNNVKTKNEQEHVTFDSSIELDNNPIKEKKGKRRSI